MASKLWEKNTEVNQEIEKFTVGRDRELDLYLARYDVLGSMAHITMLESIGLLGSEAAQTAELLRANGVLPEGAAKRRGLTPALQEEMETVPVEEKRILPGSGLPVTYEALRDEIIGALTGEKGENR